MNEVVQRPHVKLILLLSILMICGAAVLLVLQPLKHRGMIKEGGNQARVYTGTEPWLHYEYFGGSGYATTTVSDLSNNSNDGSTNSALTVGIDGTLPFATTDTLTAPAGSLPAEWTVVARARYKSVGTKQSILSGSTGGVSVDIGWLSGVVGQSNLAGTTVGADSGETNTDWATVAVKNDPTLTYDYTGSVTYNTLEAKTGASISYLTIRMATDNSAFVVSADAYGGGTRKIWAARSTGTNTWSALVDLSANQTQSGRMSSDITSDGSHILIVQRHSTDSPSNLNQVLTERSWNGSSWVTQTVNSLSFTFQTGAFGKYYDVLNVSEDGTFVAFCNLRGDSDFSGAVYAFKRSDKSSSTWSAACVGNIFTGYTIYYGILWINRSTKLAIMVANGSNTFYYATRTDVNATSWTVNTIGVPVAVGTVDAWAATNDLGYVAMVYGEAATIGIYSFDGAAFTHVATFATSSAATRAGENMGLSIREVNGTILVTMSQQTSTGTNKTFLYYSSADGYVEHSHGSSVYTGGTCIAHDASEILWALNDADTMRMFQTIPASSGPTLTWVNGTAMTANNAAPATSGNVTYQLTINDGTSALPSDCELRELRVYNTRLTNAEITDTVTPEVTNAVVKPYYLTVGPQYNSGDPIIGFVGEALANYTPARSESSVTTITSAAATLPDGVTVSSAGVLGGTATTTRTTDVLTITCTNAAGSTNSTISAFGIYEVPTLSYAALEITEGDAVNVSPTLNVPGDDYIVYSNYASGENWPVGLSVDSDTGVITGTVASVDDVTGTPTVTVDVTYRETALTANLSLTVNAAGAGAIPSSEYFSYGNATTHGFIGSELSIDAPSNASLYVGFVAISGLPAGLSVNSSNGSITGTPTGSPSVGSYAVRATHISTSLTYTAYVSIRIYQTPITELTYTNPISFELGESESFNATTNGDAVSYEWVNSTVIPEGILLNPITGTIYGRVSTHEPRQTVQVLAVNHQGERILSNTFILQVHRPATPQPLTGTYHQKVENGLLILYVVPERTFFLNVGSRDRQIIQMGPTWVGVQNQQLVGLLLQTANESTHLHRGTDEHVVVDTYDETDQKVFRHDFYLRTAAESTYITSGDDTLNLIVSLMIILVGSILLLKWYQMTYRREKHYEPWRLDKPFSQKEFGLAFWRH